jgi:chorismate mutase
MTDKFAVYEAQLAVIRASIDKVDEDLAKLLGTRLALAAEIGRLKVEYGLWEMDEARQMEILQRLQRRSGDLTPLELEAVWRVLFSLSIARQLEIIRNQPDLDDPNLV